MTNTMKRLAVLLIGTLFVLCVAIVLAVSLPVSTAFAAEGETATDTGSEATVHDHNDETWTAITADGGTLQSGNYYLTSDVTLTTDITIADNATVTLCLNGYKLTGTGTSSVITVGEGASFTLEDCSADASAPAGTGVITGGIGFLDEYTVRRGGGVFVSGNSTFKMNSGTISGNTADTGGGVGMWVGGTFTMNGGTISDNTASTGGVFVYGGTFTMNGGTISDNTANYGGGVYIYDSTFTMSGGTISDNTATNDGGGVYVVNGGMFTMTGGTISGNTATNDGGGVYGSDGTFNMSGGTISGNTAQSGDGGGVLVNNGTFTMSGGTISDNTAQSGDGGGVYFYGDNTFEMNGGTISGNTATNGGGVYIWGINDFTFDANGCTFTDNDAAEYGGGVYITAWGTVTMTDCTISGNTAKYGGGVYVTGSDCTSTLEGSTVLGNIATSNGGGVYIDGTTFIMNDGTITGNTATNGGGVYMYGGLYMSGGKSTMNGGIIFGNMAWNGGGVYMYGYNNFIMNGGTISGDRTFIGSGVHANASNGTFTMNGGYLGEDIENNGTVSISGGYLNDESNVAYIVSDYAAHDISAFGTALDSDYKDGFPYAVYANGTEITSNVNDNIIYDGSPVAAGTDFTVTGEDGVEFTYLYMTAGDEFISGLPTNAGEYTVSGYGLNGEKQFFSVEFDITVAKADYDMSGITFADDSVPYNGEEQSLAISGDLPAGVTVTYDGNGNTNVGEYTVTAKFAVSDANYNEIDDMTAKLTITKADYDMSGITFADDSVPYNGEEQSLAISGDLPAGVTVTYDGNGKVNAGEYTVTASFTGDYANYNAIPDMTATLTIEKGVPSYTAPTELTVSVGQNVADITLPDGWAWKDGDVQFGTAGEHKAIAVYTAADTANYAPVEVELTVTVSESEPTDPEQPTDPDQPGGEITSEEPEGLYGGEIAGIVIGCILGVLLIEYGVFALLYKKKLISGAFFGKIYPFIKD